MPTSHTPGTGLSPLVQFALSVRKIVRIKQKFANKYLKRLYFSKLWIWGSPVRAGEAVPSSLNVDIGAHLKVGCACWLGRAVALQGARD